MPSLIDLVNQYREDLLNNDTRAMSRLARAYSASYKSLLLEVNKLTKIIESGTYTASQVHRLTRYKTTVAQVAGELSRMQALTIEEVNAAANIGIKLGDAHARGLIAATVGSEQLAIAFNKLDPQLTRALLGFLDPNGQLYQRMNELSNFNADLISQNLTDGIIKGFNPQKIARMFTSGWGMALADSMRMVRTAQLYSYREASRATYLANSGVVEGWYWSAFHSPSTCMSCIVMDGSFHPNTETLNDHYNGRCAMIPKVKGFPPAIDKGSGQSWFKGQTPEIQKQMMGAKKWDAWKAGKFDLEDISKMVDDPVYGSMRVEASLKDLIGKSTKGQMDQKIAFGGTHGTATGQAFGDRIAINKADYLAMGDEGQFNLVAHELAHNIVEDKILVNMAEWDRASKSLLLEVIERNNFIYHRFIGGQSSLGEAMVSTIASYVEGRKNPLANFIPTFVSPVAPWTQAQWDVSMEWAAHALKYAGTNKEDFRRYVRKLMRDLDAQK